MDDDEWSEVGRSSSPQWRCCGDLGTARWGVFPVSCPASPVTGCADSDDTYRTLYVGNSDDSRTLQGKHKEEQPRVSPFMMPALAGGKATSTTTFRLGVACGCVPLQAASSPPAGAPSRDTPLMLGAASIRCHRKSQALICDCLCIGTINGW